MSENCSKNQKPVLKNVLNLMLLIGGYRKKKNIFSLLTPLSIATSVIIMLTDLFLNWTGVESLKKVAYMPGFLITGIKALLIIANAPQLINIVNSVNNFWPANIFDKSTENQINKSFKFLNYFFFVYNGFSCLLALYLAIMPLINFEKRELLVTGFSLCNLQNIYCWIVNYIWQVYLLICQIIPTALSLDVLFITLINYIFCGCLLLKKALKTLNIDNSHRRQAILKKIVNQHDFILKFVDSVNEILTIIMLLQFWCSLWSMILFLFLMLTAGLSGNFMECIFYSILYFVFIFQLFIYSLGGAILENQVLALSTDIFMVNWYGPGCTKLRKDLAFMIFRAQNTKLLNAGKMSDLNLVLFVSAIKNSFSVFTLIWQLDSSTDASLPIEMGN